MKKLIPKVVMSLICLVPIQAMERPPLFSVKNKKPVHTRESDSMCPDHERRVKRRYDDDQKENGIVTGIARLSLESAESITKDQVVTPNGKALRAGIIRKTIACIDGIEEKAVGNPEIHPAFLTDSPVRLKSRMHAMVTQGIYTSCQTYGITREKIKACYPDALRIAQSHSLAIRIMNPMAPVDLEREMKEMARKLGCPEFFVRSESQTYYATNYHDLITINEQDMRTFTHEQRAAVFAHEIMHGKHFDGVFTLAVRMAFEKEGKIADFVNHIKPKLQRGCEVFADMGAAVSSPTLAKHIASVRAELHHRKLQEIQEGTRVPASPTTHPESAAWAALDRDYVALHEKDKQEKERIERIALASKRFRENLDKEYPTT